MFKLPAGSVIPSALQFDKRKVKDRMEKMGLKATDIARTMQVNELTIYRHMSGLRRNLIVQEGMAKILKCKVEDLCQPAKP